MPVNISQEEMQIFNNNGISEEQIRDTVNLYRNDGLSDDEIRAKVDTKLQGFQNQSISNDINDNQNSMKLTGGVKTYNTNPHPIKRGIVQAGRNIARVLLPKRAENWFLGSKEDEEFLKQFNDSNVPTYEELEADYKDGYISKEDFIKGIQQRGKLNNLKADREYRDVRNKNIGIGALSIGTAFIPAVGGARAAGLATQGIKGIGQAAKIGAMNGAIGGGIYGLGESIIDEDKDVIGNTLSNATLGAGFGAALGGGTNAVAQGVKRKLAQKAADKTATTVKDVSGEIIPENINLEKASFGADIPENVNPKINESKKPDIFYNEKTAKKKQKEIQKEIDGFKVNETKPTYVNRRYKNRFWKQNVDDPYTAASIEAEKEFNSIINEIKKDPSVLNDLEKTQNFEARLDKTLSNLDPEHAEEFWTKYYQTYEKADAFTKVGEDLTAANKMRAEGKIKQSQLAQNAELPKDMRKTIKVDNPEYEVLHNDDLIANAQEVISKDANGRRVRLEDLADKEQPLTAQDFEEARQLVGQLYKEGRIDEAIKLTEKISVAGSRAGQSVQAMSLWAKTTPEGAVRQAQKIIDDYNKTARKKLPKLTEEQAKTIIEMAEDIQKLNGTTAKGNISIGNREQDVATAKLMKYLGELVPQSAGNKLKTLRNISLLLNGKTFARNITGNAIFSGMENAVTKPIAAGIDKITSLFTNKRTRVMPQFKDYGQGLKQGFMEGVEDVNLGIDTRKGIGQRFDLPQRRSFDNPFFGGLEKSLDFSLRVPDRAFYQATFNESLANQLKAAGTDKITEEMLNIANQEALESVYQNNGQIASMVSGLRKGLNQAGIKDFGLGDALIPYAQTPANVAQQGINYSPLGFFNAIKSGINGNQRQATLDAARAITGSGIIGAGYKGSQNGLFTENIEDYKTRKNYEALGIRPNQIILPNGSVMSYSQLQPLAAPLATGAILNDVKGGDYMQAMDKGIGTLADLGMLRGITDFTKDYNDDGIASAITNTITSIPSQFIGTGINQINTYIDPYQRETYSPNPIMQGLNQARAKTPFLSKTLPKKYDVAGREIEKYEGKNFASKAFDNFLNPVFVNKPKDDLVLQEVAALYEVTGEKGGLLNVPEKKIKLDDGTTKQLSGKEFSEYSKLLGEVSYRGYEKIMNTQRYLNADDSTRLKLLGDIKQNAKAIVQEELFGKANKHSSENAIKRKVQNRLNKGQNKIDRIFSKMDSKLVDDIMYKE